MPRYGTSTVLLLSAVLLLCSAGTALSSERAPVPDASLLDPRANGAQDLILKGLELVGINYLRGGTNPEGGLDCSGFVQLVFRDALGKLLPRTASEQSKVGHVIADKSELKPGDLVFFNTMRRAFSHVGIYLGDNSFVHSPRSGGEVRVEDMSQGYWVARYNGARRVME